MVEIRQVFQMRQREYARDVESTRRFANVGYIVHEIGD